MLGLMHAIGFIGCLLFVIVVFPFISSFFGSPVWLPKWVVWVVDTVFYLSLIMIGIGIYASKISAGVKYTENNK